MDSKTPPFSAGGVLFQLSIKAIQPKAQQADMPHHS